ncbi:MAG: BLUF domain-containing protein [Verrucomicrobiales bacterium]
MSTVYSVIYVSTAVKPLSPAELATLLERSRQRNKEAGITGMLLHKGGCFMQAFEGEKEAVERLHERITRDPRHRNIVLLHNGPAEQREFSGWTMGFKQLDDKDARQSGFTAMLNSLMANNRFWREPSLAIRFLLSFTVQPVDEHATRTRTLPPVPPVARIARLAPELVVKGDDR